MSCICNALGLHSPFILSNPHPLLLNSSPKHSPPTCMSSLFLGMLKCYILCRSSAAVHSCCSLWLQKPDFIYMVEFCINPSHTTYSLSFSSAPYSSVHPASWRLQYKCCTYSCNILQLSTYLCLCSAYWTDTEVCFHLKYPAQYDSLSMNVKL